MAEGSMASKGAAYSGAGYCFGAELYADEACSFGKYSFCGIYQYHSADARVTHAYMGAASRRYTVGDEVMASQGAVSYYFCGNISANSSA